MKKTKKEMFAEILEVVTSNEHKEFLTKQIAQLEKRTGANRKPTQTQIVNEGIKADIVAGMVEGERYTITDLIKANPAIADYSNQKISALANQLVKAGTVKREEDGRKTYFSLV